MTFGVDEFRSVVKLAKTKRLVGGWQGGGGLVHAQVCHTHALTGVKPHSVVRNAPLC